MRPIFAHLPLVFGAALAANASCVSDDTNNPDSGTPDGTTDSPVSSDAGSDAPAAPFSLAASPNPILVRSGTPANLMVQLTRNMGFTGDVEVSVTGLPTGVTATMQAATGGATQVVLTLTNSGATAGSVTATVMGTSTGTGAATTPIVVQVPGAPGTPDTTFGTAGIFTGDSSIMTADGENSNIGVVVQPDGKIVIAATVVMGTEQHVELVRLMPNGTLDTGFNGTGTNTTVTGQASGVALQSDGKIVVGGRQGNYVLAARYTTTGAVDTTFNGTGSATYQHIGGGDDGLAVTILANGEIVVGGWNGNLNAMTLSAFTAAGGVDTAYSQKAIFYGPNTATDALGFALAQQPAFPNYVVLAGTVDISPAEYGEAVRFDSTGTPTTFNGGSTNGLTLTGASYGITSLITLQNQSFRALSQSTASGSMGYNRVDGINSAGAVDTTFNTTGTFSFSAPGTGSPMQMVEGLDNNLVIVGITTALAGYTSRVLANGTGLDTTFGTAGSVPNVFGTGAGSSQADAVTIDAAGNIIIVGLGKVTTGTSATGTLLVTRLWP